MGTVITDTWHKKHNIMKFAKYSILISWLLIGGIGLTNGFSVSDGRRIFWDNRETLPLCPIATPVETGRIQDSELVEASGLVASHRFPGIYYSIQDSLNPDKVYAMKYNGEAIGKFDLEGIDQHDWEDITMLEYNGVDYIYVGDIGNNYDGHCRGINYEDMAIYRFPEPELSSYKNGVATIPANEITIITLKNPNMPTECDDRTKQDFECLMADQYSGDIYLVQKNIHEPDVSLFKFTPPKNSETITLREVGKINSSPSINMAPPVGGPAYNWPMAITAGDISRYGRRILVRNYPVLRMWTRNDDQLVEDAMMNNEPCELVLKDEPLGESLAIRDDETGFVTTSDGQSHPPIYFYQFY